MAWHGVRNETTFSLSKDPAGRILAQISGVLERVLAASQLKVEERWQQLVYYVFRKYQLIHRMYPPLVDGQILLPYWYAKRYGWSHSEGRSHSERFVDGGAGGDWQRLRGDEGRARSRIRTCEARRPARFQRHLDLRRNACAAPALIHQFANCATADHYAFADGAESHTNHWSG